MSREATRAGLGAPASLTPPEIRLACLRAALELRSGASTPTTIMADAEAFCAFVHRPWNERKGRPMTAGDLDDQVPGNPTGSD